MFSVTVFLTLSSILDPKEEEDEADMARTEEHDCFRHLMKGDPTEFLMPMLAGNSE